MYGIVKRATAPLAKAAVSSAPMKTLFRTLSRKQAEWFLHKGYMDTKDGSNLVWLENEPNVTEPTFVMRYSTVTEPIKIGSGKAVIPGMSKFDANSRELDYDLRLVYPGGRYKRSAWSDVLHTPENRKDFYLEHF